MKNWTNPFIFFISLFLSFNCFAMNEESGQRRYSKEDFNNKIKIELQSIFDKLDAKIKNDLFGIVEQQQNEFNTFLDQIQNYFVNQLSDQSLFLIQNSGSTTEEERSGFLKFLGKKTTRKSDVGVNTYLIELFKNSFKNLIYDVSDAKNYVDFFYTSAQKTLTDNISQYYKEHSCTDLIDLFSQLIHPVQYRTLQGHAKKFTDYILEHVFALFPQGCWGQLEINKQDFSAKIRVLRMEGLLRKYLYFYKHISFGQDIQFRFIRRGILMNAMVDFVASAMIAKEGASESRSTFVNDEFLKKKILKYVYGYDFVNKDDYETKFTTKQALDDYKNYLSKLNKSELLANYLVKQINNPAWYYIHQHWYKTVLLASLGVGSIYLLVKYRSKLPGLKKLEQSVETSQKVLPEAQITENITSVEVPEEITLPEVLKTDDILPQSTAIEKPWYEWIKQYLPKPWKSTIEVPEPKIENPHE